MATNMTLREFQDFIRNKYFVRDNERGTAGTFIWFIEEVGELASALGGTDQENREEEFADVLAWLCTLANINGVDLSKAIEKYTVKGVEGPPCPLSAGMSIRDSSRRIPCQRHRPWARRQSQPVCADGTDARHGPQTLPPAPPDN
jgi:NTP pyrophosphatase (non-canonical NTP hydrolase)